MSLTSAQLEQRRNGISASEVAAVCGLHPYVSRIDVWLDKRGDQPPRPGNKRTKWGEWIEPLVRKDWGDRHELRVSLPGTLAHPDMPWMMATPDGIGEPHITGWARGLEIKMHTWRYAALYGAPGSDEVPLWELTQCMWGMAVTGLQRWDLVAFIDGQPTEYTIDRDSEAIDRLREQCERFWIDNVVGGAVPDPDGTESFTEWLTTRWSKNTDKLVNIGDDNDTFSKIERAREIILQAEGMERELDTIVQALMLRVGDAEGLTWKDARGRAQKLTWKRNKSSQRINHIQRAADMMADARLTLSAVSEDLDRAMVCLDAAGRTPIGENARRSIDAAQLKELMTKISSALVTIAERTEDKYANEVPGNRPFCWPTSWRKNSKERNGPT